MSGGIPTVLAIDPGRSKCGVAVVSLDHDLLKVHHRQVVELAHIPAIVADLAACHTLAAIVLGNGTNSAEIERLLTDRRQAPVVTVDERDTTLLARKRFFAENPPRGLRKLIPVSLQVPDRAYDDYVAIILAERYLATL